MKNTSKLFAALLSLVLLAGHRVHAAPLIDQQQQVIDTSVGGLAIGGSSQQKLAQVVTAGMSGVLTEVRFPVACASGNLVIEIQGVTGGQPNGVVLASQTIPGASLPPFSPAPGGVSFRSLVFSAPASVSGGSQFAIVLSSTGECGLFQGPTGDPYPGGNAFFDSRPNPIGVWICNCDSVGARFDFPFQTLVGATLQVRIDIKPGSFPNDINPGRREKTPVSILTTKAFDATQVDPTTTRFGATGTEAAPLQAILKDTDLDGDTDLLLYFNTQDTGILCGQTSAFLTGQTFDGQVIEGSDSIRTLGCK